MRDHEALIDALARDMRPVGRVAPVWRRVMLWAPLALGLGFLATRPLHRFATDWSASHAVISVANVALSLTLGLAIFAASLSISLAGGRARGKGWIMGGVAHGWRWRWSALRCRIGRSVLQGGWAAIASPLCWWPGRR
jgi:hypothetical protein